MTSPARLVRYGIAGLMAFAPAGACLADLTPVTHSVVVSGVQGDTVATFSGYSFPNAFITVLDNGAVVGTASAGADGAFSKSLTNQDPGDHPFALQAQDTDGVSTPLISLLVNLQPHTETAMGNILMPATISSETSPRPRLYGYAAPGSHLTIFVGPDGVSEEAEAGPDGTWTHTVSAQLPSGTHSAYAVASTPSGLVSAASSTVNFDITCLVADENCSGRVDMVDFSVLMYYWGTSETTADFNNDGSVDLTDFSILMFYWNG